MSWTADAGSYFAPLNYTTSFTNPAQYNAAQLGNLSGYGQQTINDLYRSGGGFGTQTDYYSRLGANQLSGAVYSQGGSNGTYNLAPAGTFTDYNAGGAWPSRGGGGGASPYQTTPNVWDTGASPFLGGGGSSGMGGSIFQNMPAIDWGNVGRAAADLQPPSRSPFDFSAGVGAGMFGGLGGAGATPGAGQLDWTKVFSGDARNNPYPGMSMPGGLNQPMSQPQAQQQPIDYGSLFGRGVGGTAGAPSVSETAPASMPSAAEQGAGMFGGLGGVGATPGGSSAIDWSRVGGEAAKTDPAPGMSMPGGLNSPMTTSDQQPDFNTLWGQRTGWGQEYGPSRPQSAETGGASAAPPEAGTIGSGALGATATPDQLAEQAKARLAQIMKPATEPSVEDIFGGDKTVAAPEAPIEGEAGRSGMVDRPQTAAEELYPTEMQNVPLPRARPEGADVPRPPENIPAKELGFLEGRSAKDLKNVKPEIKQALQEFAREYNASQSDYDVVLRAGEGRHTKGQHTRGLAVDLGLIDRRNGERLTDYQTRDPVVFKAYQDQANAFHTFLEKNYPQLAATHRWGGYFGGGVETYGAQDIMHHDFGGGGMAGGSWKGGLGQTAADYWQLPYGGGTNTPYPQFNFDWSNAPIPDVGPMPLTYKSPGGGSVYQIDPTTGQRYYPPMGGRDSMGELPGRDFLPAAPAPSSVRELALPQQAAESPATSAYPEAADVPRPSADVPSSGLFPEGVPLPAARPNAAANLSQAHSLLDSKIIDLVQKNSPSQASMVPSSIANQSLRDALGNTFTGGMIRSGITPEQLAKAGITQADFDKAYAQGRPQPLRYGGEFGGMGGELPSPGAFTPYEGWRQQNVDFENRTTEQPDRDQLAQLLGLSYELPEVASTPIGDMLGLKDLQGGRNFPEDYFDPSTFAPSTPASNSGFSRYSDEGYGTSTGRAPPVTLSPEHMRTMAEIESTQNPKLHDPGSSYKGLYQLDEGEFRKYGGTGSIFDPVQNTKAAMTKMYNEGQRAQDALGRALTPVEQYMVHQQGLAGTLSHLRNPDQPAWLSFQQASKWNNADAKEAIWGNLSKADQTRFGKVENITSRDFLDLWNTMYYRKMVSSGLSPGGLSDLPQ